MNKPKKKRGITFPTGGGTQKSWKKRPNKVEWWTDQQQREMAELEKEKKKRPTKRKVENGERYREALVEKINQTMFGTITKSKMGEKVILRFNK